MAILNDGPSVNIPAADLNGPEIADGYDYRTRYAQEREKRIRSDGLAQYIDPAESEKHGHFLDDPWVAPGTPVNQVVPNGGRSRILIIGAGFGGILMAVRLLQAGVALNDLLIVDPAGGFGGTWYWNRYPGLMCDVESYIYMPLLEETDYMPKRKYATGLEIREYCEVIDRKFRLSERAMFQSDVKNVTWDSDLATWNVAIAQHPRGGERSVIQINADFVLFATGVLVGAKIADLPGLDSFQGDSFHTARWDYEVTGGSQADPQLTKLQSKKVGIIGTGATAVQAVPHLAKWAKDLYVFQRTPSSIDVRNNRDTDPDTWKQEIATAPGWQRKRNENFNAHMNNYDPAPSEDLVNDQWTKMRTYSALIGGRYDVTLDGVADHVNMLNKLDFPRQQRIRQRAEEIVKDAETAQRLQAWYPSWCKRPCFHDEYLPSYNSHNVTLVDTHGKGVDSVTPHGISFDGTNYDLDVLIWATGYANHSSGSPAAKAHITVTGKNNRSLEDLFITGLSTLHGAISRDFPNLFFPGPSQTAATANFAFMVDTMATHIAYIIATASARVTPGKRAVVEPTVAAQEGWLAKIQDGAIMFAGIAGCTPGYINREGQVDKLTPEEQANASRGGLFPGGYQRFLDVLEAWRENGEMEGLEIEEAVSP